MKRDIKAFLTASALALSLVIAPTVSVLAAEEQTGNTATITGYADDSEPGVVLDETGQVATDFGSQSIDIQASILGSSQKIIYSIEIGYGDMKFTYDFGQTWDPESHTYTNTGTNASKGGWVTANRVDAKNNAIRIQNNSNYPISVSLTYQLEGSGSGTLFNADPNANGSVIGIFSDDNDTLKTNINKTAYNGQNSASAGSMITKSFDLDMDYSNLTYGTYEDYGVLNTNNANSGKYYQTVYFTLCGTPDSSATLSTDYSTVGTIKVTVTPASNTKVIARPAS
jgi:hypothetical protein